MAVTLTAHSAPHQKLNDKLWTNEQAAYYVDIAPGTLEVWRCTKRFSIPYLKLGRLVRYRREDLDTFLTTRTVGAITEGK